MGYKRSGSTLMFSLENTNQTASTFKMPNVRLNGATATCLSPEAPMNDHVGKIFGTEHTHIVASVHFYILKMHSQ